MPRPYSEQFIFSLHQADPKRAGAQLAKLCVKANLPTVYIAKTFGVSRMSIHSWFRGQPVRDKNNNRIEQFISLVEKGLADGSLPAINIKQAKEYLESKIKPNLIRV